jgi:hypothetical protein
MFSKKKNYFFLFGNKFLGACDFCGKVAGGGTMFILGFIGTLNSDYLMYLP